jgi:hypothetical protein
MVHGYHRFDIYFLLSGHQPLMRKGLNGIVWEPFLATMLQARFGFSLKRAGNPEISILELRAEPV